MACGTSALGLFKDDLAITAPKAKAKVAAADVVLTWAPYPEAASYKVYFGEIKEKGEGMYVEEMTSTPSFTPKGPLAPGKYSFNVDARSAKGDMISTGTSRVFFVR